MRTAAQFSLFKQLIINKALIFNLMKVSIAMHPNNMLRLAACL